MKRTRLILVMFVLIVGFCASCTYEADVPPHQKIISDPEIEIVVHQTATEVIFEFFYQKPTSSGSFVRERWAPGSVAVEKDGRIIWDIAVRGIRAGQPRVQYGFLPMGFEQRIPEQGAPPALEIGKEYRVFVFSAAGGQAAFVYKGAGGKTK